MNVSLELTPGYDRPEEIRSLFTEYTHMLDTLPFLESAIHMYRKRGFYQIPCYNDSPMETTIFMQYDL